MSSPQAQAYGALLGKIGDYAKPAMKLLYDPLGTLFPKPVAEANAYLNANLPNSRLTSMAVGMYGPGGETGEMIPEGVHPMESAETMFERMFNKENAGEYTKAKELAEWETGHPEGVQSPAHRAEVTKEWNKPRMK